MFDARKSAAAAAAALALGLGWALTRSAPRTMPQRSPSGRVYLLTRSAPVSFPGGAAGLGVQYLAETAEPQTLAASADEIMTNLRTAADTGKFRVIVVDALVPGRLWGRRSRPIAFGRGEDGVWRRLQSREHPAPPADPADLRALDEAYARIERAVEAKDVRELEALQAETFWHRLADGTTRARAEENAAVADGFKVIQAIKPSLRASSIAVEDGYAVVVASMTSVVQIVPKAGGGRLKSVTVSRDSWIKTAGGWRLALAADLLESSEPLR